MSVTQKDIAKAAHIEQSSVSRILRNDPRMNELSEDVRASVRRIAAEMGYQTNISAATIRKGINTSTIAAITVDVNPYNYSYQSYLFQSIRAVNQAGYGVRVYCGTDFEQIFREINANQIQYVICYCNKEPDCSRLAGIARRYGMKMIFNDSIQRFLDFPVVDSDNVLNMGKMVDYLHDLGHRRIAFACGECVHETTILRYRGFLEGMKRHGLRCGPRQVFRKNFNAVEFLDFLRSTLPTALCCVDPSVAILTESALLRAGVRIPEDISMIVYGDGSFLFERTPRFTCLREVPAEKTVQAMLKYLFTKGSEQHTSDFTCFFEAKFIKGESAIPPCDHPKLKEKLDVNFINNKRILRHE
ncbi:MAG: HTH-type transcriptional repressor CytR [Lentisphaerae bacterium ADurb.Bin242]|nr:MAG: HTH-type transcriptional repressor CytR [Lentisphaerae bacterium ADurb.Bin242]